jgi:hypothetical protein
VIGDELIGHYRAVLSARRAGAPPAPLHDTRTLEVAA